MSTTTLSEIWPVISALVIFIIWLVRLEAKVLYLDKELEKQSLAKAENDQKIWDKFSDLQSTLTVILQSLARLEGRLENKTHE